MEGSEGMAAMQRLMKSFRESPPQSWPGSTSWGCEIMPAGTSTDTTTGQSRPLSGPTGDLVILDLAEEGNYVAVRPSGTEPKIKLYVFTRVAPEQSADLDAASAILSHRLERVGKGCHEAMRRITPKLIHITHSLFTKICGVTLQWT